MVNGGPECNVCGHADKKKAEGKNGNSGTPVKVASKSSASSDVSTPPDPDHKVGDTDTPPLDPESPQTQTQRLLNQRDQLLADRDHALACQSQLQEQVTVRGGNAVHPTTGG